MQNMSVDEIHGVVLDVLKHIHCVCSQKSIKYGLAYGTLLGAIRHKGFIPWDDDADLFMPRPDYNRFLKEYGDTDEYKLFAPERYNSGLPYARICEMKRTWFGQNLVWTLESPGLGVDIFPYDAVSDNDMEYEDCVNVCMSKYWDIVMARALVRAKPQNWWRCADQSLWRKAKNLCWCIRSLRQMKNAEEHMLEMSNEFSKFVQGGDFEAARLCGVRMLPAYARKERIPSQWIARFQEVCFCDTKLSVPVEYDKILKNYYNDYMRIPDEVDRVTHSAFQTMKWR